MKKHLIYMGYTGKAHRIALFDESNIVTKRVPVKDVTELSDDLKFLNCTVINGVPYPNLKGAKVLCSRPSKSKLTSEPFVSYTTSRNLTEKDLRVFPNKKIEYEYGGFKYGFSTGNLISHVADVWDGMCKENYVYVLGEVLYEKDGNYVPTNNTLGMTHLGSLCMMTSNTRTVFDKNNVVLVQASTPDIYYENTYVNTKDRYAYNPKITVAIPKEDKNKVIWVGKYGKNDTDLMLQAEYIWWGGGMKSTVWDLRRYPKGKTFGISACAEDASVVIFPESTEELWFGMFYECKSLKAVYIPENVKVIYEMGLPPRRFKPVTLYSNSSLVKEYCEREKVAYKPCASADDMLKDFYGAQDDNGISVDDAGCIAALSGDESNKGGASGTIWSAILLSIRDKGMATSILQERYPVVETCNYEIPNFKLPKYSFRGSVDMQVDSVRECCRTLAGAFTQFYPLCTEKINLEDTPKVFKFRLCDYNIYVVKDVLYKEKLPQDERKRDLLVKHNIAMLEDVRKGRIIHQFACNELLYSVLCNLEGACVVNREPCGVLRYADKLPVTYIQRAKRQLENKDKERQAFVNELFTTFLPIQCGIKTAKYKMIGIDLHTGNIVTLEIYPSGGYRHFGDSTNVAINLVGASAVKNICEYPDTKLLSALFDKDCVYNKNKS